MFGFRQSTKLVMDKGYKRAQLVGLLEDAHLDEYIRIKKAADVDALRGCTPDMLALVHARLDSKDDFFIDIPSPQENETPAGIA